MQPAFAWRRRGTAQSRAQSREHEPEAERPYRRCCRANRAATAADDDDRTTSAAAFRPFPRPGRQRWSTSPEPGPRGSVARPESVQAVNRCCEGEAEGAELGRSELAGHEDADGEVRQAGQGLVGHAPARPPGGVPRAAAHCAVILIGNRPPTVVSLERSPTWLPGQVQLAIRPKCPSTSWERQLRTVPAARGEPCTMVAG